MGTLHLRDVGCQHIDPLDRRRLVYECDGRRKWLSKHLSRHRADQWTSPNETPHDLEAFRSIALRSGVVRVDWSIRTSGGPLRAGARVCENVARNNQQSIGPPKRRLWWSPALGAWHVGAWNEQDVSGLRRNTRLRLLVIGIAFPAWLTQSIFPSQLARRVRKIHLGMSRKDVEEQLGPPWPPSSVATSAKDSREPTEMQTASNRARARPRQSSCLPSSTRRTPRPETRH